VQWGTFTLPRHSYNSPQEHLRNYLLLDWEEPPENLAQHTFEVYYAPDPTYNDKIGSVVSLDGGKVFIDGALVGGYTDR
jgi:hypothetical protein